MARFRVDPVPDVGGFHKYRGIRRPKTLREKRLSLVEPEFVRAKRNAKNLPDTWDDKNVQLQRSWKKHRKTQYKTGKS